MEIDMGETILSKAIRNGGVLLLNDYSPPREIRKN